ncbi:hypothetical protein JXA70_03170 [candidate division KSB1 bacterium]|nr:hypothetical protein [candidate division KSB1 bacterium]
MIEIEIAKLASIAVGTILVPFLKQGAKKFAELVGDAAGEESASLATKVWEKVKSAFGSGKDKERIASFEEKPEEKKNLITELLEEKLSENEQLAKELDQLIRKAKTKDGDNVVQIIADKVGYVDARHATMDGSSITAGYIGTANPRSPASESSGRPMDEKE